MGGVFDFGGVSDVPFRGGWIKNGGGGHHVMGVVIVVLGGGGVEIWG